MPTYARADVVFERGEGAYLFASDGRRYLDFGAGIAVNSLGHAHPQLVAALKAQGCKLWHCSNLYRIPGQERVARLLIDHTFADTVFFCNSGAEAIEGTIKLVRKYQSETGHPERYRLIVAEGAFHGRTLATLAAGGQAKHLKGFGPVVDGFDRVPFGDLDAVKAAIGKETAGILVEPVQGEGGIRPLSADYLRGLRKIADEAGILLAFDEVQCGNGRTGQLYAHQWSDVTPDVMGTAKGLGGGFPMGAVLATEKAAVGMTAGAHGTTFGGNPLAMAVAEVVLQNLTDPSFLPRVRARAEALWTETGKLVEAHPKVFEERRGLGLMLGLKCRVPNTDVAAAAMANGLLTVTAGDNVLRLVPPLIIEPSHIAEAIDILNRAASALAA